MTNCSITVAQAAEIIGVTRQRIAQLIALGDLSPVMRTPKLILLDVGEVEIYAKARRKRQA